MLAPASLVCRGLVSFGSETGRWQHRPRVRWLGAGRRGGLHVLAWDAGMVGAFVTLGSEQITCRAPAVVLIGVAPGPAAVPSVLHCGEGGCCGQPCTRGQASLLPGGSSGPLNCKAIAAALVGLHLFCCAVVINGFTVHTLCILQWHGQR